MVDIIPFRRSGKWLIGAIVQEDEQGRKRIKVFKGRIKEDGKYEVVYKGQRVRFSLSQRLNIPSARYWEWLKEHIDPLVRKHLSVVKKEEREEHGKTLFDYV